MDGLTAARARGRKGGRPKVDLKKIELAIKGYESKDYSLSQIMTATGIGATILYRYLDKKKILARSCSMRVKELLTEDQRTEFVRIPDDMSESELETYYTFSQYDLEIIKRHRRDHNSLDFAVQLCVLRYPGWSLSDVGPIPDYIIKYIASQINVNPNSFSNFSINTTTDGV